MKQDTVDHTDKGAAVGPSPHRATSVHLSSTVAVTGNGFEEDPAWAAPPSNLTQEQLEEAHWLGLSGVPASPGAVALVASLTALVGHHEAAAATRKKARRSTSEAKLRQAVGAIVAGLLRGWARREPHAMFRSRKAQSFTGAPVAARQYLAACDALVALGLVGRSKSIRYGIGIDWGAGEVFQGKARRLWPMQALLDAATSHGITSITVKGAFGNAYPTKPPKVPEPLQLRTLKDSAPIPVRATDEQATKLRQGVLDYNAWIDKHAFTGCQPPRLKRVFTEAWSLGGRCYALGNEGCYQRMSPRERLAITIGGEPVREVDVRASQLSIMHGLLGLPLPDGDPYAFDGLSRTVTKVWITNTLGKGSPVRKWAAKSIKDHPEIQSYDAKAVGAAICARYPFLARPAAAVATVAGLDKLAAIGTPQKLLPHRLMNLEALALTAAMGTLQSRGILALPIHDGLLVPASGAAYAPGALVAGYSWVAKGIRVGWKVTKAGDGEGAAPVIEAGT